MWWKRRKIQGLLAASLYEPLSAGEQNELDRALAASSELQADADALRRLVDAVPDRTPELGVDLLPLLHARLSEVPVERPVHAPGSRRLVWASACVLFLILAGTLFFRTNQAAAPGDPLDPGHSSTPSPTLLAQTIREADISIAEREPGRAYDLLLKGVKAQPDDPLVAEAQVRIADLAYELGRYSESLEAHNLLVTKPYSRVLEESPGLKHRIVERRDLLAEAAAQGFQPLYDLTIAMQDRDNELAALEKVIVDNPHKLVADLAAENMGRVLADESEYSDVQTAYLEGMKEARAQCTNPNAIALLDLKIGDLYRYTFNDIPNAESQYRKASENPVLAKRAGDALETLTTGR